MTHDLLMSASLVLCIINAILCILIEKKRESNKSLDTDRTGGTSASSSGSASNCSSIECRQAININDSRILDRGSEMAFTAANVRLDSKAAVSLTGGCLVRGTLSTKQLRLPSDYAIQTAAANGETTISHAQKPLITFAKPALKLPPLRAKSIQFDPKVAKKITGQHGVLTLSPPSITPKDAPQNALELKNGIWTTRAPIHLESPVALSGAFLLRAEINTGKKFGAPEVQRVTGSIKDLKVTVTNIEKGLYKIDHNLAPLVPFVDYFPRVSTATSELNGYKAYLYNVTANDAVVALYDDKSRENASGVTIHLQCVRV